MGFLKKIMKPFNKIMDPFLPESVKKAVGDGTLGQLTGLAGIQNKESGGGSAAAPAPAAFDSSSLSDDQLQAEAQKRMAKLGKYFTSPLGVLQNASTGSQKVFS